MLVNSSAILHACELFCCLSSSACDFAFCAQPSGYIDTHCCKSLLQLSGVCDQMDEIEQIDDTVNQSFEDAESVQGDESPNQPKKKIRKLISPIWQNFDYLPPVPTDKCPLEKARCKACGIKYNCAPKYGTGNMIRHIEKCPKRFSKDVKQMLLSQSSKSMSNSVSAFDAMVWRRWLAKMVTKHNLPLSFVEYSTFREACRYLNPNVQFPCRNTTKKDCINMHGEEKSKMKETFLSYCGSGRVSLTSDCWSSSTGDGYICLTGHYIDSRWRLQKRILSFKYFGPPHSGKFIAEKIEHMLTEWGIDKRVFSITLDNASANDSAVTLLRSQLRLRNGLLCEGKYLHIRCAAHIMNLIVQDGLKDIDESIKKVRDSVRYVKGSQARKKKFFVCVFRSSLEKKRGLVMDVATRWNSTYLMLERASYFERAFVELSFADDDYQHCPSEEEWKKMNAIRDFLEVFYNFTLKVSAVKHPTSNLFFPLVFRVHNAIKSAMVGDDINLKAMSTRMFEKFNKYWRDFSDIMAVACVLDLRYKFHYIQFIFLKLYDDGNDRCIDFKQKLYSLYDEYAHLDTQDQQPSTKECTDVQLQEDDKWGQSEDFESFVPNHLSMEKSQLDKYLEEPRFPEKTALDVMAFWKVEGLRFPAVAAMAKDVLAIPISSVASESAFSTFGNILDDYRSLLGSDILESLVCWRDWILAEEVNEEDSLIKLLVEQSEEQSESVITEV